MTKSDAASVVALVGRLRRRALEALVTVVLVSGCAADRNDDGAGRLRVVATTGMITDIVRRVAGDRVALTGLMGPGIDPHLYKASAGDVTTLARADIIFYNGLHLEAAMGEVLEEMGSRIRTVAVTAAIDRRRLLAPAEFAGAYDPHVWFDVSMWMSAVQTVARTLAAEDTAHAATYREQARVYIAELDSLHRWVEARVAEIPEQTRVLITAHDAFNYFGRAYGLEVRGLQGISTVTEAGTGDVQRLAELIVRRRIPAIFVETSVPRRTVEAVQSAARSRGIDVAIGNPLFSDAMGDPNTPEGTYPGMIRHNVNTIVDALRAPAPASP
jgi:manganese/zinc/iron transport system substrate-binding protein